MSAGSATQVQELRKREDFPVTSLRYLEGKLGKVRNIIMTLAAELAAESSPDPDVYRVEPTHVSQAMVRLFRDFPLYEKQL